MNADWFVPALAPHVPSLASAYRIERRIESRDRVALTFDDGPHAEGTPAVLEELARRGATATFFLVGEQVAQRPALAREIVDAGHEVAVHGYRHTLLLRRRVGALADDLDRAVSVITDATGVVPVLYRPPYGVFSSGALAHVRARGWRPLLWSTWGRDWERRATARSIARRATKGLEAGDVVLLHDSDAYSSDDSWRRTAAAVPSVLDAVAALGLEASSVTHST
ncbi:MAG: polysaccharide deacetylase family protein [Actinomycetia bacterium]|nr:polysaccharide deacetylase family protein [Actinomycetes bacterium]